MDDEVTVFLLGEEPPVSPTKRILGLNREPHPFIIDSTASIERNTGMRPEVPQVVP